MPCEPHRPRPHAAPSGQSSWRAHVDGAISLNPDEAGTTHDLTKRLPVCLAQSRSAIGASVRALWEDLKPWNVWLRLAIEPAWLGSAQLELARYGNELARYGNELARLGSLPDRAESQARLGSFSSSSQLVWLVSQLEKKNCQLAEPKRRATS